MKESNIQPIINHPILHIKDMGIIVVADLHIGIEKRLREQGLFTESQTENMTNSLKKILKKIKAEKIILLGDIKHNIPSTEVFERRDVKNFLNLIKEFGQVHIVPGNHDGLIKNLISEDIVLHSSKGLVIDNIAFIHGHRWPSEKIFRSKDIIMAHTHPTVMLVDRLGIKSYESCWVKANFIDKKLKEKYPDSSNPNLLIIPAFNPLCGGISINKEGINGPLGKIIDINNSNLYMLDGTYLGKVKNLNK